MFDYSLSEQAVIGCLLIDERCYPAVREILPSPEVFASRDCGRAYEAVCSLARDGKPMDPVTVGRMAGLDNGFLARCMDTAPSCSGFAIPSAP